jgi:hypothetical protein
MGEVLLLIEDGLVELPCLSGLSRPQPEKFAAVTDPAVCDFDGPVDLPCLFVDADEHEPVLVRPVRKRITRRVENDERLVSASGVETELQESRGEARVVKAAGAGDHLPGLGRGAGGKKLICQGDEEILVLRVSGETAAEDSGGLGLPSLT